MPKKKATWEMLKTGVRRNGSWYASAYSTGWYFVRMAVLGSEYGTTKGTEGFKKLGPFKTFEDGLKSWEKEK
jgi:hypothetical protein